MAKVSSRSVSFEGASYTRTVYVNNDGVFSINLPQAVVSRLALPQPKVSGTSLAKVEATERKLLAEYNAAQTTKRKVIVYRVRLNAQVKPNDPWTYRTDIAFLPGIGVGVWARVYTEQETLREGKPPVYRYTREESQLPEEITRAEFVPDVGERDGRREKHQMPWSAERERFFSRANELLHALAVRLYELTEEPEHFAELAEQLAGTPLLGGKKGEP